MGSLEPRTTEGVTLLIPLCQRTQTLTSVLLPSYRAKPIGSLSVSGLSGVPRLANRCAMIIYIRNSCQAFALKFLIKYNVFLVLRRFIFQKCPKMAKNGDFYAVIYCRLYPQKTPIFSIILPIIRCHTTGDNTPILRLSNYLLLALMIVSYY